MKTFHPGVSPPLLQYQAALIQHAGISLREQRGAAELHGLDRGQPVPEPQRAAEGQLFNSFQTHYHSNFIVFLPTLEACGS